MNRTFKETGFKVIYLLCAIFSITAVVLIGVYLFAAGIPSMAEIGIFKFLFGTEWNPAAGKFGILTMIVNSLYVTAFAGIIGIGLGVFGAVFMSKFCPKKIYKPLRNLVNLLAGIPSVVYGFFGVQVIIPVFSELSVTGVGYGVLASGIILGIMILPTVMSVSLNSINNVPESYYEGAVSLGATHSQAVFKVVVPSAKNGIVAGSILGVGRAIGETMAVVMVSGNNPQFATSFFEGIRTLTGNIVLEMSYAEGLHRGALISTGIVLFVFILLIMLSVNSVNGKSNKDKSYRFSPFKRLKERISRTNKTSGFTRGADIYKGISIASIVVTVSALFGIIAFIFIKGVPHLSLQFLFGKFEYGGPVTLLPSVVTTLMLIFLSLVIAVPIGIGSAVYLTEYTKKGNKFVKIIRGAVETLAGVPSIIYGLFGMIFFSQAMGLGYSITSGSLTLAIMILPTIIRTTEQALLEVPDSYREGSLALGAGKTRTIFKVVLPTAASGIVTAVMLSIGRIIGESAAVLFTVGSTKTMPAGFGSSGISMAVFMYILAGEGFHVGEAYATAVMLLLLVALLNGLSALFATGAKRRKAHA